jgi:hypothetical protein
MWPSLVEEKGKSCAAAVVEGIAGKSTILEDDPPGNIGEISAYCGLIP